MYQVNCVNAMKYIQLENSYQGLHLPQLTIGSYVSVRSSDMKHVGSLESTRDAWE